MEPLSYKKIRLLVFGFIGLCLVLIGIYIFTIIRNPYGDQLEIVNLNKYTAGKASDADTLKYIKSNLFRVVNLNTNPHVKSDSVEDIIVREGSFSQTYNKSNHIYTVYFIVDIKSLKQSYGVSYQWAKDGEYASNTDEYGTQVSCLAIDKLIYKDFNCKDDRILEKGKRYDPVEKILPHSVQYKYTIKTYSVIQESGKVVLRVEAFVPSWEDTQSTLDSYSKEIKDWLVSKKLNPDKYQLEYIY